MKIRFEDIIKIIVNIIITSIAVFTLTFKSGVDAMNKKIDIVEQENSVIRTSWDYILRFPSDAQLDEINNKTFVEKTFLTYGADGFKFNSKSKDIDMRFAPDMQNVDISFFTQDTLLEGDYNEDGLLLDKTAADRLNVKVGDQLSYSFHGVSYNVTVSAIYSKINVSTYNKGLGLVKYTETMKQNDNLKSITMSNLDLFVKAKDSSLLDSFASSYVPEKYSSKDNIKYVISKAEAIEIVISTTQKENDSIDKQALAVDLVSVSIYLLISLLLIVFFNNSESVRRKENMIFNIVRSAGCTFVGSLSVFLILIAKAPKLRPISFYMGVILSFTLPLLLTILITTIASIVVYKLETRMRLKKITKENDTGTENEMIEDGSKDVLNTNALKEEIKNEQ